MKPVSFLVAAVAAALSLLPTAAAAKGGGGYAEHLEYVADYGPQGEGQENLALCHLVKKYHVLFIPIYYQSEGYVLAENRCDTDSFYHFKEGGLAAAKAVGLLPADLPDEPSISLGQRVPTILWGLLLAAVMVAAVKRRSRRNGLAAQMSDLPQRTQVLLNVLCHAAKSDGRIAAQEIGLIAEITRKMTGTDVSHSRVEQIAAMAEKKLMPKDFERFANGLDADGRESIVKAVLLVLAADNKLEKAEQRFLNGLISAFKVSQLQFQRIMSEMREEKMAS